MDVLHNFFSTLSLIRSQFGPCFVSMCWLQMLLSIFLVKKLWLYLRQRFPFFCLCSEGRPPDLITVFHLSLDDCVCHLKENNGLSQNPAKAIWTQYDTSTVKCSPADANNSYSLRILAMFYICWLKYTHIYRWTHTLWCVRCVARGHQWKLPAVTSPSDTLGGLLPSSLCIFSPTVLFRISAALILSFFSSKFNELKPVQPLHLHSPVLDFIVWPWELQLNQPDHVVH